MNNFQANVSCCYRLHCPGASYVPAALDRHWVLSALQGVPAMSDEKTGLTRRGFLPATAAVFTIVPRHVLGAGYAAPSDKLNIAAVGVGGMGQNYVKGCASENIVAIADVDHVFAAPVFKTYPGAKVYQDFRVMLGGIRFLSAEQEKLLVAPPKTLPRTKDHYMEWVNACKGGAPANCNFEFAAPLTEIALLGVVAQRTGKFLLWDAEGMRFPNDAAATQ